MIGAAPSTKDFVTTECTLDGLIHFIANFPTCNINSIENKKNNRSRNCFIYQELLTDCRLCLRFVKLKHLVTISKYNNQLKIYLLIIISIQYKNGRIIQGPILYSTNIFKCFFNNRHKKHFLNIDINLITSSIYPCTFLTLIHFGLQCVCHQFHKKRKLWRKML